MISILKTFSHNFVGEISLRDFVRRFVIGLNVDQQSYWYVPMTNVPKQKALWCYIVVGGRVRYRATIAEYQPGGWRHFEDGRSLNARAWMVLTGPVVHAPERIERKGFQGFRYTEPLF